MTTPIRIFIAYSRKDSDYLDKIRTTLNPLERQDTVKIWYDGAIVAGETWDELIKENLHKADVILLLLSPDSLASDYFYDQEVANALARHQKGECRVVPVIVRDCLWEQTQLAKLQALPQDAKPIALWQSPDAAYKSIAVGVTELVKQIKTKQQQLQEETDHQKTEQKRLDDDGLKREHEEAKNKKQFWQQLQDADSLYAQQKYPQAQTAYQNLLNWQPKTDLGYTDAQPHLTNRLISCKTEIQHAALKKQAFDLYQQGKYAAALQATQQALQHRTDPDLGNLQNQLTDLLKQQTKQRNALFKKIGMGAAGLLLLLLIVWGVKTLSNPNNSPPTGGGKGGASKPHLKMISIPGSNLQMSETEVTIGQYLAFCNATNSHYPEWLEQGNEYNIHTGTNDWYQTIGMSESNTNYPITGVSALDADAFCQWIGGRLSTGQEWEYAAKGGQSYEYAGSDNIDEVAWYDGNSSKKAHPVKQKQANGYGLYDMSGNVWEWTSSTEGANRVLRGGSWDDNAVDCRMANRGGNTPAYRGSFVGFRVVFVP